MKLVERDGGTLLSYEADFKVGGKLAQVGSRLIDGAARKMADDFFSAFGKEVSGQAPQSTATDNSPGERTYERSGNWVIWAVMFAALAIAMILAF